MTVIGEQYVSIINEETERELLIKNQNYSKSSDVPFFLKFKNKLRT